MSFGGAELAIIGRLSERRFNLSHSDARILLTGGGGDGIRSSGTVHATGIINEGLAVEQRVKLIEMSEGVG